MKNKIYNWQSEVQMWNTISNETSSLLLTEAEKALQSTLDTDVHIEKKTDQFSILIFSIITIAFPYLLYGELEELRFASAFLVLNCVIAGIALFKNHLQYEICVKGAKPTDYFNSVYIDDTEPEVRYHAIVMRMLESIQDRIDENTYLLNRRADRIHLTRKILICLPISFAFPFIIPF